MVYSTQAASYYTIAGGQRKLYGIAGQFSFWFSKYKKSNFGVG
jgi:hypothetical protein